MDLQAVKQDLVQGKFGSVEELDAFLSDKGIKLEMDPTASPMEADAMGSEEPSPGVEAALDTEVEAPKETDTTEEPPMSLGEMLRKKKSKAVDKAFETKE